MNGVLIVVLSMVFNCIMSNMVDSNMQLRYRILIYIGCWLIFMTVVVLLVVIAPILLEGIYRSTITTLQSFSY